MPSCSRWRSAFGRSAAPTAGRRRRCSSSTTAPTTHGGRRSSACSMRWWRHTSCRRIAWHCSCRTTAGRRTRPRRPIRGRSSRPSTRLRDVERAASGSARASARWRSCTHITSSHVPSPASSFNPEASSAAAPTPRSARFPRFSRVDRFVGTVLGARDGVRPVPTTITCALDEENYANNATVAQALAAQGYPVDFHAARGGHDWPTWRRALESHLVPLLGRAWR